VSSYRLCYAVTAMLALIGLGINLYVTMAGHPDPLTRIIIYFSYFTILTNILAMLAGTGLALGAGRLHRWASRPGTRTAIAVHITVVAIVYQLLLAKLAHHTPLSWWGNLLVHQLVPALWVAAWLLFPPHGGIDLKAPLRWLIYPLLYGAWTIAHGAASGWYPYPFMDVAKHGGLIVTRNMALMTLFFAGLCYAFRWIDNRLGGRALRVTAAA